MLPSGTAGRDYEDSLQHTVSSLALHTHTFKPTRLALIPALHNVCMHMCVCASICGFPSTEQCGQTLAYIAHCKSPSITQSAVVVWVHFKTS